jgi:PAS domain S-box-containing protein
LGTEADGFALNPSWTIALAEVLRMFPNSMTLNALKIAVIYALVAGAWILFTDEILTLQVHDQETLTYLSMAKGWFFVLITAGMLFLLVKRALTEICRSRDYYLKILEDFPALIWRAGTDAKCDYFNRTWLAFAGRALEQELGDGWVEGVHPDDREKCLTTYRDAFASRKPFVQEYRMQRHDGEYRWLIDHARPLYDQRGTFAGFIGSCHDVTERKQAEEGLSLSERRFRELNEELAHQTAALEEANQELEAFCHTASHDLRTPLTGISLSCQVIMELCGGTISKECKSAMHGIIDSVEWMDQLITSLLSLSGISRSELMLETVDLSEMAHVIVAELRLSQPDRRATFTAASGITAYGDANLLRVVMSNLISNAWKYAGKMTTTVIEFGVTEHAGDRTYFVRDNGVGFDMGQADRLFAAFQRLHGSKEYEGHGIGLATVQRIVQRHGGRAWAEGEEGRGATFYFTLSPEPQPAASS